VGTIVIGDKLVRTERRPGGQFSQGFIPDRRVQIIGIGSCQAYFRGEDGSPGGAVRGRSPCDASGSGFRTVTVVFP